MQLAIHIRCYSRSVVVVCWVRVSLSDRLCMGSLWAGVWSNRWNKCSWISTASIQPISNLHFWDLSSYNVWDMLWRSQTISCSTGRRSDEVAWSKDGVIAKILLGQLNLLPEFFMLRLLLSWSRWRRQYDPFPKRSNPWASTLIRVLTKTEHSSFWVATIGSHDVKLQYGIYVILLSL